MIDDSKNKTEMLCELLKKKPMTRAEIDIALGFVFARTQIKRLIKAGTLEEFDDFNEDASKKWARFVVRKLRLKSDYKVKKKKLSQKTLDKYIDSLRNNGYEVVKVANDD